MSLLATLERQRKELVDWKVLLEKELDWLIDKIENVEADINEVRDLVRDLKEEKSSNESSSAFSSGNGHRNRQTLPGQSTRSEDSSRSDEKTGQVRKRAKNDVPLKTLVLSILKKHHSGLTLKEIVVKCREAGYKSSVEQSDRFSQIVYQQLHKLMNPPKGIKAQVARCDNDKSKYQLVAA